jgi:MFS family permease
MTQTAIAALSLVGLLAASTTSSPLFVAYRSQWAIGNSDIALVFSAYAAAMLPTLLILGGSADRYGRRPIVATGVCLTALGLVLIALAHGLPMLIAGRLLQGVGVGLSSGAISASLSESYRGRLSAGRLVQSVAAIGMFTGALMSAVAFNAGGGLHASYLPSLLFVIATLSLTPMLAERTSRDNVGLESITLMGTGAVRRALRFALPLIFVSMAGLALYLSLVPVYLASALHASNPAVGAVAVVVSQVASLVATLLIRDDAPQRTGLGSAVASVFGLAMLVIGTATNLWILIALATLIVGAGCGVGAAAALSIAGRVGRGQRARIFGRLYVAAYAGFSVPTLLVGFIATHTSFTTAFLTIIVMLALIAAVLPAVRESDAVQRRLEGTPA